MKKLIWLIILFPILFAGVEFDGVDDKIPLTNNASLYSDTPLTVGMWFKVIGGLGGDGDLFGIGENELDRWALQIDAADSTIKVYSDIDNSGLNISTTTNVFNVWHSVIVTIHGTNGTVIYIDGVSEGSDANAGAKLGFDDLTQGNCIAGLGLRAGTDGPDAYNSFVGIICDFFISNSVWTDNQIKTYSAGKIKRFPLQDANLICYLELLDEPDGTDGNGDTFLDMSESGNSGTGNWGANASGLTAKAEEVLSYPGD